MSLIDLIYYELKRTEKKPQNDLFLFVISFINLELFPFFFFFLLVDSGGSYDSFPLVFFLTFDLVETMLVMISG